jgi:hypothetical protein
VIFHSYVSLPEGIGCFWNIGQVAMEIADKNMQQYSHTMQLNAILRGKNNQ